MFRAPTTSTHLRGGTSTNTTTDENACVGVKQAVKCCVGTKGASVGCGASGVQQKRALESVDSNTLHQRVQAKAPPMKKQVRVQGPRIVGTRAQPRVPAAVYKPVTSSISIAASQAPAHHRSPQQQAAQQQVIPKPRASTEPMAVDDIATDNRASEEDIRYEDIDEGDEDDPIFCSEYVREIFAYLRRKEVAERIDAHYMLKQRDINAKMRGILMDWMAEVHLKFKLLNETLFLSALIVDKYLAQHEVPRQQLQLLGVTAMLIASKVEEIYAVAVNDLVFICDKACTAKEIRAFERKVLQGINFQLNTPSSLYFLRRFSKAGRADSAMHSMSKYLIELALLDYSLLEFPPSHVAAAAVYLTRRFFYIKPFWNDTLRFYTKYKEEEVAVCARQLQNLFGQQPTSSLKCIFKKYSSPRFYEVAVKPILFQQF